MHLKDYYGILEIKSSATLPEIKKAYRKLAQQYHPDKNLQDPYATAQFAEIKEAYEVLTNPSKKEYYLQQRWYEQSIGKKRTQTVIDPVNVLKQALELEKYVSKLDHFRMDKEGLRDYIAGLIPASTIEKLNAFNDPELNSEILNVLLHCLQPLPLLYALSLQDQLLQLKVNKLTEQKLADHFASRKRSHQRDRYKIWAILLIVLLLCLLIFFLSGKN